MLILTFPAPSQRVRWAMEPYKRERTLNSKFNLIVQQQMEIQLYNCTSYVCAPESIGMLILRCRRTVTKTLHEAENHSTRNPYEYFMHSNNMNRLRFTAAVISSLSTAWARSAVAEKRREKRALWLRLYSITITVKKNSWLLFALVLMVFKFRVSHMHWIRFDVIVFHSDLLNIDKCEKWIFIFIWDAPI